MIKRPSTGICATHLLIHLGNDGIHVARERDGDGFHRIILEENSHDFLGADRFHSTRSS